MDKSYIMLLPTEILIKILSHMHYKDIINYGATCKRANMIVTTYDDIFIYSLKNIIPDMQTVIEKYELKYYEELKSFFTLKKKVESEISKIFYKAWMKPNVLDNVENIYTWAAQNNTSYYYIILHLQNIIENDEDTWFEENGFAMAQTNYAKFYLFHLMHPYLTIKWVQLYRQRLLEPTVVANYFVQWIDPSRIYKDSDVDNVIEGLVEQTKSLLETVNEKSNDHVIRTELILNVLSYVINKKNLFIIPLGSTHSELRFNAIADVFESGAVTYQALMAIYQAAAKRLGVNCELELFGNQFFLEWQNDKSETLDKYLVEIVDDTLQLKRVCPYQRNVNRQNISIGYDPTVYLMSLYQTLDYNGISRGYEEISTSLSRLRNINFTFEVIDLKYITESFVEILKLITNYTHPVHDADDVTGLMNLCPYYY